MQSIVKRVVCRTVHSVLAAMTAFWFVSTAHADEPISEKTLRIHLTARNPHPRVVSGPVIRFFSPIASAAEHELIRVAVNQPYQTEVDAYGNRAIVMQLPDFAPYSTHPLSLSFTVRHKPQNSAPMPSPGYRSAEPLIESTHPEIVAASQLLAGSTPLEIARNAQQWIVGTLSYAGYQLSEAGALAALRTKRGDCTEYAYLFAALMRARGIPARVLGGYVMPSSRIVKPFEYHNWAEFYADGKWNLADPQRNVFMKEAGDYIATRIVVREQSAYELSYPHRFLVDSSDIELVME